MEIPALVKERMAHEASHWTKGANKETTSEGYFIEHAGSLFMGDANKQNTLDEILEGGLEYGFVHASIELHKGVWNFSGNYRERSNVFQVYIWDANLVPRIMEALRTRRVTGIVVRRSRAEFRTALR